MQNRLASGSLAFLFLRILRRSPYKLHLPKGLARACRWCSVGPRRLKRVWSRTVATTSAIAGEKRGAAMRPRDWRMTCVNMQWICTYLWCGIEDRPVTCRSVEVKRSGYCSIRQEVILLRAPRAIVQSLVGPKSGDRITSFLPWLHMFVS
jgi:hypothetical protein